MWKKLCKLGRQILIVGGGRFCSKSCKAKKQTKREFYKPRDMWFYDDLEDVGRPLASGFFGHGQDT